MYKLGRFYNKDKDKSLEKEIFETPLAGTKNPKCIINFNDSSKKKEFNTQIVKDILMNRLIPGMSEYDIESYIITILSCIKDDICNILSPCDGLLTSDYIIMVADNIFDYFKEYSGMLICRFSKDHINEITFDELFTSLAYQETVYLDIDNILHYPNEPINIGSIEIQLK